MTTSGAGDAGEGGDTEKSMPRMRAWCRGELLFSTSLVSVGRVFPKVTPWLASPPVNYQIGELGANWSVGNTLSGVISTM